MPPAWIAYLDARAEYQRAIDREPSVRGTGAAYEALVRAEKLLVVHIEREDAAWLKLLRSEP